MTRADAQNGLVAPAAHTGDFALELHEVSKSYPGVRALRDVSFSLKKNSVLGLVGENGAGKSTILSVINGTTTPDSGRIVIAGDEVAFGHPKEAAKHGVATVFQEQGLIPSLPVYENVFLGTEDRFTWGGVRQRARMIRAAAAVLEDLGVSVNPRVVTEQLTFGERQLVEISKAFATTAAHHAAPIILLDEPTSALSAVETELLFDNVRGWRSRGAFILVSHRISDLQALCDDIVVLRDGEKVAELPIADSDEANLHRLMVGRERDAEYYQESEQSREVGTSVLSVRGLSKQGAFQDVTFEVGAGEVVGLAGVLGSGRSELARAVAGALKTDAGEIAIEGQPMPPGSVSSAMRAGVAYVPAERSTQAVIGAHTLESNFSLPLLKTFTYGKLPVLNVRKIRDSTSQWIKRLGVKATGPRARIGQLSGGNQQKIVFARCLAMGPRLLVLDDPGRGLDVGAKADLYALIRDFTGRGGAVLLVSDTLAEVIGLSNKVLVMKDGLVRATVFAPAEDKPSEEEIVREMV
ncbi:sugar ABC transporter ATP-binding protein [Amycolatopsis sp. CA-161197]|uniref:sugar ABC transporter ATP-binding protein n=1 Tax=Amycolatopsis sp. CA-161197 TaxID=3239922 RepID=UPI003D90B172